jgi:hypothetical protein
MSKETWVIVYSAAYPLAGTASLRAVKEHKEETGQASLASLCTTNVNPHELSSRKPSGIPPHNLNSFRNYRHKCIGISATSISASGSAQTISRDICFFPNAPSYVINNAWISGVTINESAETISITLLRNDLSEPRTGTITLNGNGLSMTITITQAGSSM